MKDELCIIVPSRGRPAAAAEMVQAFQRTCTSPTTRLVIVVDEDDPERGAYFDALNVFVPGRTTYIVTALNTAGTMVGALNEAATVAADSEWFAIGFMGDDHRPRTPGWDTTYLATLRDMGSGIVYGDDLFQRERLPTQCAMTADIIRALGYMAPPTLRHMYVDNFWLDLGRAADCIRYLPEVVIEHKHPLAGKAKWDEGYDRVNAREVYQADFVAYRAWAETRFVEAVEKVTALAKVTQ